MIDIVTIWAGAGTIGSFAAAYLWLKARDLTKSLEGRVTKLRGDNLTLEKRVGELSAELTNANRKLGLIEAEMRARKPKRGPNGKFVAKPKAPKPAKPAKSTFKTKPGPIACG